jgi:hypothetical protein
MLALVDPATRVIIDYDQLRSRSLNTDVSTDEFISLCYDHSRAYQVIAQESPVGSPAWQENMTRAFYLSFAGHGLRRPVIPQFDDGYRLPKTTLRDPISFYEHIKDWYDPNDTDDPDEVRQTVQQKTTQRRGLVELVRSWLPRKPTQVLAGAGD